MTANQPETLVGYSLSFCVGDILQGLVKEPQVTQIIASIAAPTRDDFMELLDSYARNYWSRNPDEGKAIALRLYDEGKIDQPRLRGENFANVGNGHWKYVAAGKSAALPVNDSAPADNGTPIEGVITTTTVAEIRETTISDTVKAIHEGAPVAAIPRIRLKGPGV